MGRLQAKHWALIASFLTATFTVTAGLDHWSDLLHPAMLSGLGLQLATLISAVFVGAPKNPNVSIDSHPARRRNDRGRIDMGSVSETHSVRERF